MGKSMSSYMEEFNNLLVVDGLNVAFRYKARTNFPNQYDFAAKYISTVQSLATSYKAKKIIVLGDGGSYYRKSIYPEYKANRDELVQKMSDAEKEDFDNFISEFNNTLEKIKEISLSIRLKGVEADDLAAAIVFSGVAAKYDHIWLVSSDKDWDLMISDKVSRFSTVTRKEITLDNWSSHYSYDPEDHISFKVLEGDKGDNVPGVDGVGPKRAAALLKDYGTAHDLLDALPLSGSQKFIQNLNAFGKQILLNYELMDLESYYEDNLLDHAEYFYNIVGEYLE